MSHILVIADFEDDSFIVLEQAQVLAKAYDCSLRIVNFCYENLAGISDIEAAKQAIISEVHENSAHKLVNTLVKEVDYDFETVWAKNIHLWINDYVTEHKPKMVVKTGHRSEALFYTPTDWHLIRECNVPVMIATDKHWHKANTVLATVDLATNLPEKQQLNEKVLQHASILAKQLHTDMHICYTIEVSPTLSKLGIVNKEILEIQQLGLIKDKVKLMASNFGVNEEHIHIKTGEIDKVVTSVAAACKASHIVVGTVGRKGLEQKLIGNSAEAIMHLAKTDILVLKP
ncbi:universal stress protein [Thalassomonas sp. M1454]|uniref:universal stress protein n=1 Tax=Thalassomonas sp. M1454 TaxID=2594477 RepID=UPI00117D533A|nr:universal stress protein [Thalassomonas sp. M1454]TRX57156.1 hypothetical protein FNN08_06565 [Thalassomonas sp. M1454]